MFWEVSVERKKGHEMDEGWLLSGRGLQNKEERYLGVVFCV